MLTSLHIQNFKGFKDTLIPELRKVNLIVGGQNVGKTSLLEAVVFVAGDVHGSSTPGARSSLSSMFRPCEGDGDARRFWRSLVGEERKPVSVGVHARIDDVSYVSCGYVPVGFEQKLNGRLATHVDGLGRVDWFCGSEDPNKPYPSGGQIPQPFSMLPKPAQEQVELYGRLVTGKKKKIVLKLLQKIEPRIDSVDAVAPDGEHRVYVDLTDGHVLPISQLGHGFTRLFELYAGLAVTESKLALIDEIENGIHYSALPTLLQGVRELAEANGVQSIITTHSLECIKSAYEVFQDKQEDFQLIRLERTDDGNVRAVVINDENLKTVMESGWEIR